MYSIYLVFSLHLSFSVFFLFLDASDKKSHTEKKNWFGAIYAGVIQH